jgi:hypothetical protein
MPQHRVPTAIQEARGSYLRHPERKRARSGEPKPAGPIGSPPQQLKADEKDCWLELIEINPNVLELRDRWHVEETACLMALSRRLRAVGQRLKAAEQSQLMNNLAKMGMNPADRSRVHASQPEDKSDDPLSRLLSPTAKPQ